MLITLSNSIQDDKEPAMNQISLRNIDEVNGYDENIDDVNHRRENFVNQTCETDQFEGERRDNFANQTRDEWNIKGVNGYE